ncbi:hypothetical protein APK09_13 [Acinetobacter phage APK09]|uniref:Uncharacterized protein n=1 Tax=Acinetobacter phage APK09 TaxID=2873387 RepID=A0AAE8XNR2_9CAUD|nr:hypothetical protein APK09_13 [Acinetobacter phage APK09]
MSKLDIVGLKASAVYVDECLDVTNYELRKQAQREFNANKKAIKLDRRNKRRDKRFWIN